MNSEEENRGCEIYDNVEEIVEKNLQPQYQLTLVCMTDLFFDLLKGEVTAVDPSLSLTHQTVYCLYGVDLG